MSNISSTTKIGKIPNFEIPVWLINHDSDKSTLGPPFDEIELLLSLDKDYLYYLYRGTSFNNIETVFKKGVDVEPSDSVIYAASFEKAWEYGNMPKLILAYDQNYLKKTYKEVSSDISKEKLAELRRTYPTKIKSEDGKYFWLSRLSEDDPRITKQYETAYAYWIQDNPLKALKGILVFSNRIDTREKVDELIN